MVSPEKLKDFLVIALKGIAKRRMRSWLTMVGIFIGIAAVVALVSLGQGLTGALNQEFEELGANRILVTPGGSLFGAGGVASLAEDDQEVLERVRGVDRVAGYVMTTAKVEWEDEQWWHFVVGIKPDPDQLDFFDQMFTLDEGRYFREGERFKAVVGYDYATHPAFEDPLEIGDSFTVNDQEFEVVGSFEKVGNSNDDRTVVIPMETARELLGIPDRIDTFMVEVKEGEDVDAVVGRIEQDMRKDRDLKEGDEDFNVQSFKDVIEGFLTLLDIATSVIVGIAAISLLIGAIGIMNTMYTAVLERTKEIGIMKAIGARNGDVLTLFLIESGLLGIAGGIIGILLGAGFASLVAYLAQTLGGFEYLKAFFPWWLLLGSLLFSFIVGVLAGVLPAYQASRKNPVDSLRYE